MHVEHVFIRTRGARGRLSTGAASGVAAAALRALPLLGCATNSNSSSSVGCCCVCCCCCCLLRRDDFLAWSHVSHSPAFSASYSLLYLCPLLAATLGVVGSAGVLGRRLLLGIPIGLPVPVRLSLLGSGVENLVGMAC